MTPHVTFFRPGDLCRIYEPNFYPRLYRTVDEVCDFIVRHKDWGQSRSIRHQEVVMFLGEELILGQWYNKILWNDGVYYTGGRLQKFF